jgi:hypothetical protein
VCSGVQVCVYISGDWRVKREVGRGVCLGRQV